MVRTKPLFVMISQTDTAIARIIRAFCRYPYNHVSLTLDRDFRTWYSYARYAQDTPFYGGFIQEPAERFLAEGDVTVRIFRIEVPEKYAEHLDALFCQAGSQDSQHLYNIWDAIASGFGLHTEVPGAHTCLSFACQVLGMDVRSIEELSDKLSPFLMFEGSLSQLVSDSGNRTDRYFTRMGLFRGTAASAAQFGTLSCRLVNHSIRAYLSRRFRRTVS